MEIIGYISALFIGLSLGLIGSGGTILAVPILVYLFNVKEMSVATHYSMFIVGMTAFVGAFRKYQEKLVDIKTAVYFLIPSLISLFLTRKVILVMIPEDLFHIGSIDITRNIFLLCLFAIVMLFSSVSMIKNSKEKDVDCFADTVNADANHLTTTVAALIVGVLTGLLGAGGGFLIVPVLILLKGHCMKRATGTSLLIIAVNSLVGFVSNIDSKVNWSLVLIFSSISILGMMLGIRLSDKIEGAKLKKIFGIMVLLMGIYIIIKELFL